MILFLFSWTTPTSSYNVSIISINVVITNGTKCNVVFAAHVFEDYKYSKSKKKKPIKYYLWDDCGEASLTKPLSVVTPSNWKVIIISWDAKSNFLGIMN